MSELLGGESHKPGLTCRRLRIEAGPEYFCLALVQKHRLLFSPSGSFTLRSGESEFYMRHTKILLRPACSKQGASAHQPQPGLLRTGWTRVNTHRCQYFTAPRLELASREGSSHGPPDDRHRAVAEKATTQFLTPVQSGLCVS